MKYIFTIYVCLSGHPDHCDFVYRDGIKGNYHECIEAAKDVIRGRPIREGHHVEYACKAEEESL